jgi:hypothetical protein
VTGRVPAAAVMGKPMGRLITGAEVWRVPGPPWTRQLSWSGPGDVVHLHATARMDALGIDIGAVSGPCHTLTDAQAAADAWWAMEQAGNGDGPEAARLIAAAAAGQCALHANRKAVAAIVGAGFRPKGACEACAKFAEDHTSYTVHHRPIPGRGSTWAPSPETTPRAGGRRPRRLRDLYRRRGVRLPAGEPGELLPPGSAR